MEHTVIEFFRDTICSFCFPMSYRMRQLRQQMPGVKIVHRSFALVREEDEFDVMFGSRAEAKEDILGHWAKANENDDLHRFNIEGMRKADFPFPSSMKALVASKAAYFAGGDDAYWDVFDALQHALFVQSRNIGDQGVIEGVVRGTKVDFAQWKRHCADPNTREAVEQDLRLVEQYGIHSVPCLIVNGKVKVSGALPMDKILQAVQAAAEENARG